MLCRGPNCGLSSDPRVKEVKKSFFGCFNVFQTSKQFRSEALYEFINNNVWRLELTHFGGRSSFPNIKVEDDDSQVSRLVQIKAQPSTMLALDKVAFGTLNMPNIVHFYTNVDLSRWGSRSLYVDWPDRIRQQGRCESEIWLKTQIEEDKVRYGEVRSEQSAADGCVRRLRRLQHAQEQGYCRPRSLTIEVTMHESLWDESCLDQCGLKILVKIFFFDQTASPTAPKATPQIQHDSRRPLEPKRDIFSPLFRMGSVKSIAVERKWVLAVADPELEDDEDDEDDVAQVKLIELVPMYLRFRYNSVREMIDHAGPNLHNLRRLGLTEAQVKAEHVLSVRENKDVQDVQRIMDAKGTKVKICPEVTLKQAQEMNQEEGILFEYARDDGR